MDAKEFFEIYEKLQPMKEPIQYKNNGVLAKKVDNDRYIVKINDEIFYIPATIVETGKDWELVKKSKKYNVTHYSAKMIEFSNDSMAIGPSVITAIENLLNGEEKKGDYTEELVKDFATFCHGNYMGGVNESFKTWKEWITAKKEGRVLCKKCFIKNIECEC